MPCTAPAIVTPAPASMPLRSTSGRPTTSRTYLSRDSSMGPVSSCLSTSACFRFEMACHRQHDVGVLGGRVREQVGVYEGVERRQRVAPSGAVSVGHHQVGTEVHQPVYPVPATQSTVTTSARV